MTDKDKNLLAINDAIAKLQSGERIASVAYEGYTVHYAPVQLKELIALRDTMARDIKASNASRTRQIHVITSKGAD
jgi:hypothetical protein